MSCPGAAMSHMHAIVHAAAHPAPRAAPQVPRATSNRRGAYAAPRSYVLHTVPPRFRIA